MAEEIPGVRVARELVAQAKMATLSTLALRPRGYPFGSLVAVAADDAGRPLLLLSKLAEHAKNLAADPRASLLVTGGDGASPLAEPRVTVLGTCKPLEAADLDAARARYLDVHPEAAQWAAFADFSFYRLEPEDVRLVAGFGRMEWIDPSSYARG